MSDDELARAKENLDRLSASMLKGYIESSDKLRELRLNPPKKIPLIKRVIIAAKRTLTGIFMKYRNALWTLFIALLSVLLSMLAHKMGYL